MQHRNPDPALEFAETCLVSGWRWALTSSPRPNAAPTALERTAAYDQRGREVAALIEGAHSFEPRLGQRVTA